VQRLTASDTSKVSTSKQLESNLGGCWQARHRNVTLTAYMATAEEAVRNAGVPLHVVASLSARWGVVPPVGFGSPTGAICIKSHRRRNCRTRNYLSVMASARTSFCPQCNRPMKLVHTIPPLEPAWPALLAFYCAPCSHAETKEDRAQ
jgi:hypothetical protein